MNETDADHDNQQGPHQGLNCGNQPPLLTFPDLPTRPALPEMIHLILICWVSVVPVGTHSTQPGIMPDQVVHARVDGPGAEIGSKL